MAGALNYYFSLSCHFLTDIVDDHKSKSWLIIYSELFWFIHSDVSEIVSCVFLNFEVWTWQTRWNSVCIQGGITEINRDFYSTCTRFPAWIIEHKNCSPLYITNYCTHWTPPSTNWVLSLFKYKNRVIGFGFSLPTSELSL